MARNRVFVELKDGVPVRILKKPRYSDVDVKEWPRSDAISAIRHQIFVRTNGQCEYCGETILENGSLYKRMHMHETKLRSLGGDISVENSVGICYNCHVGKDGSHPGPIWK